jgi:hypothetical protein
MLEADGLCSLIDGVLGRLFAPSLPNNIVLWDLRRQSARSIPRPNELEGPTDSKATPLSANELRPPDIKHENNFPLRELTFDADQDLLVLFEDVDPR